MALSHSDYPHKVLMMIHTEMGVGEVRALDKSHNNYQRFVDTVKSLMDKNLDRSFGFEIEFNPDYTKFRKLPYAKMRV